MEMAPSGIPSLYDNLDQHRNNYHHTSSLLLSPFPAMSSCIKSSFYSDHDYIIKHFDESPSPAMAPEDHYMDRLLQDNEVVTSAEDEFGIAPHHPESNLDPEVTSANVLDDVALVAQEETFVSNDADFLQGLDELDFDLDGFEPSREAPLENNFQNFIDATLDDTMEISCLDDAKINNVEEEDVYKKEFFMKHFRLQKAVTSRLHQTSTTRTYTNRNNRKRKHEEEEETSCSHSSTPADFVSSININITTPTTTSAVLERLMISTSSSSSTQKSHDNFSHHHHHNYNNNDGNTSIKSSSASKLKCSSTPLPTSFPVYCVPAKSCSCASGDWQRTMLYSTARSPITDLVQTSPSTASVISLSLNSKKYNNNNNNMFNNACLDYNSPLTSTSSNDNHFTFNAESIPSPSMVLSDKTRDRLEFDLLDKGDLDDDTKDLLQWLDDQDNVRTTICGSGTSSSYFMDQSNSINSSGSSTSNGDCNNIVNMTSTRSKYADSSAVSKGSVLSPKSPHHHNGSLWDNKMDSFTDLEAYVTDDEPSPSPSPVKKPTREQLQREIFTSSTTNTESSSSFSSHKPQLRLSILADISRDYLNSDSYNEKKDAIKRDILKSWGSDCHNNVIHGRSNKQDKDFNFRSNSLCDSPFSSPSSSFPSSPSSPESSPSYHQSNDKNLELLDLFSDENAAWCF